MRITYKLFVILRSKIVSTIAIKTSTSVLSDMTECLVPSIFVYGTRRFITVFTRDHN